MDIGHLIGLPALYLLTLPVLVSVIVAMWLASGILCAVAYRTKKRLFRGILVLWVAALICPLAMFGLSYLAASAAPKGLEPLSGPATDIMFLGFCASVDSAAVLMVVSFAASSWVVCFGKKGKGPNKPAEPMPLDAARNSITSVAGVPPPAGMAHG